MHADRIADLISDFKSLEILQFLLSHGTVIIALTLILNETTLVYLDPTSTVERTAGSSKTHAVAILEILSGT